MLTLTQKELTKLCNSKQMPWSIRDWCVRIATSDNLTQKQIAVAKEIVAMSLYVRNKIIIYDDTIYRKPKVTVHQIRKTTRNRRKA